MSSADRIESRILLESLDEQNELPYVRWNSRNTWFAVAMGAIGWGFGMLINLGIVVNALLGLIGLYIGYDIVRSTPPYINVTQWIKANLRYWRQPDQYYNAADAHLDTDSTIRAMIQTPDTTRSLTRVDRLYPPHGIVKINENEPTVETQYAALLRYSPPSLDFATQQHYIELTDELSQAYNDMIDFDVSLYITTRPVDMNDYFDNLVDRLDDPDVENNEIFSALIQEMIEERQRMLDWGDIEIPRVYFIVTASEEDVSDSLGGDDEASQRSRLFGLINRGGENEDLQEKKERLVQRKLQKRVDTVKSLAEGGNQIMESSDIEEVSAIEAAEVLESYWGEDLPVKPHIDEDLPVDKITMATDESETPTEIGEVMNG